jgi:hypothetical protein
MYVLLAGFLPFQGDKQPDVFEKIRKQPVKFSYKKWD